MNRERMERLYRSLADAAEHDGRTKIGRKNLSFDMGMFLGEKHCGTAGCIGGFAIIQALRDGLSRRAKWNGDTAGDYLGLDRGQTLRLMMAPDRGALVALRDITAADAALAVRKLIDSGIVDWSHVAERLSGDAQP